MSSCKSWQKTSYDKTSEISSRKLKKEIKKQSFSARSFDSRVKIHFEDNTQQFSGNGQIRILKDSIIWASINLLGIPMAKLYITPHKVRYYNKINGEYYDGDFEFISNMLGQEIQFSKLQNIFLGDVVKEISISDYNLFVQKDAYVLQSKKLDNLALIKLTPFFKVLTEKMQQANVSLDINYESYNDIENQHLPRIIKIDTQQPDKDDTNLKIEYKSPRINRDLRFPFTIPSGYKPMVIE